MNTSGKAIRLLENLNDITNYIKELEIKRLESDVRNVNKIKILYDVRNNILKELEELNNDSKC